MKTLVKQESSNGRIEELIDTSKSFEAVETHRSVNGHQREPLVIHLNSITTWGDLRLFGRILQMVLQGHVIGQDQMVEAAVAAALAGIKPVFIGQSGIGKTHVAKTLMKILGLKGHIFPLNLEVTGDDINGYPQLNWETHEKVYSPSPFLDNNEILVLDELSRTTDKAQDALFEVMERNLVTVDRVVRKVSEALTTIATMNPAEEPGTRRIVDGLADRFHYALHVSMPAEKDMEKISFYDCDPPEVPSISKTGILRFENSSSGRLIEVRFGEDCKTLIMQSRAVFKNAHAWMKEFEPDVVRHANFIRGSFRDEKQWANPPAARRNNALTKMATIFAILRKGDLPKPGDAWIVAPGCLGMLRPKDYATTDMRIRMIKKRLRERFAQILEDPQLNPPTSHTNSMAISSVINAPQVAIKQKRRYFFRRR